MRRSGITGSGWARTRRSACASRTLGSILDGISSHVRNAGIGPQWYLEHRRTAADRLPSWRPIAAKVHARGTRVFLGSERPRRRQPRRLAGLRPLAPDRPTATCYRCLAVEREEDEPTPVDTLIAPERTGERLARGFALMEEDDDGA